MAKKIIKRKPKSRARTSGRSPVETDSAYFLKMVMYLIVGSQWLRIESLPDWSAPIPIGLMVGMWFATHDHFKIDRKIEFVVLLIATFVAFWLPMGIVIQM